MSGEGPRSSPTTRSLRGGVLAFSRPRGSLWTLHGDNLMHGEPGCEVRRRRVALPLALPEALVASAHTVGLTLSRIHALLRALESEIIEILQSSALGTLALEYDVRDAVDDRPDRPRRRAELHLHLGEAQDLAASQADEVGVRVPGLPRVRRA